MEMVKQYITVDEVYPLYEFTDSTYYKDNKVEISKEFYKEYIKTSQAFWSMQKKLEELYNGNT